MELLPPPETAAASSSPYSQGRALQRSPDRKPRERCDRLLAQESHMKCDAKYGDWLALLDIQLDDRTGVRVSGSVAADERHHQPWGIVHGGLYASAIETFASIGALEAVRDRGLRAVGVANATDLLRPHRSGRLRVIALAVHQGRTQQLWQ